MKRVFITLAIGLAFAACNRAEAWKGGFASPEAVAIAVVEALNSGDRAQLQALTVGESEWKTLLWPQFPSARPEIGISADDAWMFHVMNQQKHLGRAHSYWSGQNLRFKALRFTRPTEDYKTFRLLRDPVVEVVLPNGAIETLNFVGSIVEYNGSYRLLTYRDS